MSIKVKEQGISRKDFIKGVGTTIAGAAVLGGVGGLLTGCGQTQSPSANVASVEKPQWPFPYVKLDPDKVAKRAYDAYQTGAGCGYGVYEGIIGELAEIEGYPYNQIPTESMTLAAGGYAGQGTLCGALGGAAVAIGVVTDADTGKKIVGDLWKWYKDFPFPEYKGNDVELPTTLAGSILCADSVGNFMEVQGCAYTDPERKERCGRLTGDVAKKVVTMLNELV